MRLLKKISVLLAGLMLAGTFCSCGGADAFVPKGFKKISDSDVDYKLYVPDNWIADLSTGVTTAYFSNEDRSNISFFMAFEVDDTIIQGGLVTSPSDESTSETEAVTTEEETEKLPDTEAGSDTSADTDNKEMRSEFSNLINDIQNGAIIGVPDIKTIDEYWEYYSENFRKTFPDMEYVSLGENMLLSGKAAKKYVYTATVTGEKYQFMQVVMLEAGTVYIFTYTAVPKKYESHLEEVEAILGYISIDF